MTRTPSRDSSGDSDISDAIWTPSSSVSSQQHNKPSFSPDSARGARGAREAQGARAEQQRNDEREILSTIIFWGSLALVIAYFAGARASIIRGGICCLVVLALVYSGTDKGPVHNCEPSTGKMPEETTDDRMQKLNTLRKELSVKLEATDKGQAIHASEPSMGKMPKETADDRWQKLNALRKIFCATLDAVAKEKGIHGPEPFTGKMPEETADASIHKLSTQLEELSMKLEAVMKKDTKETTESPAHSPQTPIAEADKIEVKETWDHSVPWPGNSYMIIEKSTRRSICYNGVDDLWLEDGETKGEVPTPSSGNTWLCIEEAHTFFFFNKGTCRYLGSLDTIGEPAPLEAAPLIGQLWATFKFIARAHPRGGYELFLHEYRDELRAVAVAEDNRHLHARRHVPTLWEFHKV